MRAEEILREILAVPEAPDSESTDSTVELAGTTSKDGEAEPQPHPNEAINQPDFPPRVYFNDFNPASLNILAIYWYHPPEYWDYLDHARWINLQIMERFKAAGDDKRPLTVGQRWVSEDENFSQNAVLAQGSPRRPDRYDQANYGQRVCTAAAKYGRRSTERSKRRADRRTARR